jgi:hypothetical protein
MQSRGTRMVMEVEVYATNLTNKTKFMSTNASKKLENL